MDWHQDLNHHHTAGDVYTIDTLTEDGWQFVCSSNDSFPGEMARTMDKWSELPAFDGETLRLTVGEEIIYTV